LARILGVPPTRITQWLSRKANPGSEATIKIIEFLENPEAHRQPGRGLRRK